MFIIYLLTIIIVKAYNLGIADFDQFKALLVLGETIFAAYVGQIVHAMFSAGSTEATEPSGVSAPGTGERKAQGVPRCRDGSRAECAGIPTTVATRVQAVAYP
jgi:hypothetical protein